MAICFSTSPLANSSDPSMLLLLNGSPPTLQPPRRSSVALLKPLSHMVSSLGGATSANLSCANSTQIAVPAGNSFSALEDAPKDTSDDDTSYDAPSHHTARASSSCFAVAAYVQWLNMTAWVFTQTKPPRPARPAPQSAKSEGPAARPHNP
jgi:hypothetical protein